MKIIRLSGNQIRDITKTSAYKVRYKKKFGPEEYKVLNIESPEAAVRYIKKVIDRNVEILGVDEVAKTENSAPQKQPIPQKSSPARPIERNRTPRNVRTIRTPGLGEAPSSGFRVNYYNDFTSQGDMKSKVYDVATHREAIEAFKRDFPNGIMEGNPIKLQGGPVKTDYDEIGRRKDQPKKEWINDRHLENLPADIQRERLLERERQKG